MGSDNLKKIPQRTCIGCNVQKNKSDLIRIVMNKEGNISIDKTGKANKSKKLERSFERKIDDTIYNSLRNEIIDKN